MAETTNNTVFLVAGEPSGDALGAPLMRELEAVLPNVRFSGVGGTAMKAAGLDSLFPMEELAVMGFAEVLPRLPNLIRRIGETANAIRRTRPQIVVTIDSPDFTLRVAKRVAGLDIPIVHYVAPTVWAWRPGRAQKLARLVDHVMTLLPFEPPYFEAAGLDATFVGHPIVEAALDEHAGPAFRKEADIGEDATVLCILPGSRRGEIERLMPVFGETVAHIANERGDRDLHAVIPTLPYLETAIRMSSADWSIPVTIASERSRFEGALLSSDAALCASGTVVLELARAGLPSVVAYRVNPLTAWIARRLITLKHVSLVNIVAGRNVMPEHLQENCRAERLAADLSALLDDPAKRAAQQSAFQDVMTALGAGGVAPSRRAAEVVATYLKSS